MPLQGLGSFLSAIEKVSLNYGKPVRHQTDSLETSCLESSFSPYVLASEKSVDMWADIGVFFEAKLFEVVQNLCGQLYERPSIEKSCHSPPGISERPAKKLLI